MIKQAAETYIDSRGGQMDYANRRPIAWGRAGCTEQCDWWETAVVTAGLVWAKSQGGGLDKSEQLCTVIVSYPADPLFLKLVDFRKRRMAIIQALVGYFLRHRCRFPMADL